MGTSPGWGVNAFLPLPRPDETARTGKRAAVLSARPPSLRAFLGAATIVYIQAQQRQG